MMSLYRLQPFDSKLLELIHSFWLVFHILDLDGAGQSDRLESVKNFV